MALKDDPVVRQLAAMRNGPAWAKRLVGGTPWGGLSKAQKRAARAAGVVVPVQNFVVPSVPRLLGGNPTRGRRAPGQPGNAADRETITRSEPLGTLSSFDGIKTWVIDPRSPATFPLLCRAASGYNQYQFLRLALRYTPLCGADATGALVFSYTSDSTDTSPTSRLDLYQTGTRQTVQVAKGALFTLPVPKDTRSLRDCTNEDGKLVDAGKVYVACDNVSGVLGQLFIEYSIVLKERQFNIPDTQELAGVVHTLGPRYVEMKLEGQEATIRLVAAGRWLVTVKGDKHDQPRVTGCRGRVTTASDATLSISVITVTAEEPNGLLKFKFAGEAATTSIVYVSRM